MYVQHLSSLQFLTYVAFFAVVVAAIAKFVPGRAAPVREAPYSPEELGAHDHKVAKYFIGGGFFLVLGSVHMVLKNLPWIEEYLARTGYAGHLVRDLSNTHVMIVGGGTLIATGLCWLVLPRVVGRPLASEGLAQCAFWFTVLGLAVFYVSLVVNGILIGRLVQHGWDYELAKEHMGKAYKVPTGIGAGVMGLGYWCFATNVIVTIFQGRLVRAPSVHRHLWKYFATGAAALTIGTVQGVIQVQPANARWLHSTGHAGEWIDPISHAHINLVTGLTMLVAGVLFAFVGRAGGIEPSRKLVDRCFFALLGSSLAFYFVALYLGVHEGRLVHNRGLTPEQAEKATAVHPFLLMGAGLAMFISFWALLAVIVRAFRHARPDVRWFVLAGCGALAIGTLQGPVQAFPAVNELLDEGGTAGDVIVNLHAQLNMLGGLMVILMGLSLLALHELGAGWEGRRARRAVRAVPAGMLVYYTAGIVVAAVEAHRVSHGVSYAAAVRTLEPWAALIAVPAALLVLTGFAAYAGAVWRMSAHQRLEGRRAIARAPGVYTGRIPNRVRRQRPVALAGYELPMALLGFPGVGWLFAGFPFTASVLLLGGPAFTWALIPAAFSPYGPDPLRAVGWKIELVWLPTLALVSSALLIRAHIRRLRILRGEEPRRRRRHGSYRTKVGIAVGALGLLLVSLPFVAAVAGIGGSSVRYSLEPRLPREVTGQFLRTPRGPVKLFAWSDPQGTYPHDALRVHSSDVRALVVRAAAVDAPAAYQLFDLVRGGSIPLTVRARTNTQLTLAPARPVPPGHYAFVATHEGMFGGRDYDYLTVVAPGAQATLLGAGDTRRTPAVAGSLLPVAAALLAFLFFARLALSAVRRPAGQKVLWALGFLLFAVAATAEALAHHGGWTPALFRTYYVAGGVLTVACLGAGSAWLLLPRRARDMMVGALALASIAAVISVVLAPVDASLLAATPTGQPPANATLGGHAFLWAIALNSFGTLFLVGGSLYSIARRRRVRVNLWIGTGALVVALATGLSRAGSYDFVYAGELVGIALMFGGFMFAGKPSLASPRDDRVGQRGPAPLDIPVTR